MSDDIGRYALVTSGIVSNVILWDGNLDTWSPPEGSIAILVPDDSLVSIGWTYADGVFSAPPNQE